MGKKNRKEKLHWSFLKQEKTILRKKSNRIWIMVNEKSTRTKVITFVQNKNITENVGNNVCGKAEAIERDSRWKKTGKKHHNLL